MVKGLHRPVAKLDFTFHRMMVFLRKASTLLMSEERERTC